MAKSKKEKSFVKSFYLFNTVIVVLFITVLSTFFLLNKNVNRLYFKTVSSYEEINSFYNHISTGTSSLKSYLSFGNEVDFDSYNSNISDAKEKLENIKKIFPSELHWRVDLLDNMVDTYTEAASNTVKNIESPPEEYRSAYNEFLHQDDLIKKTSSSYYELATEFLEVQQVEINRNESVIITITLLVLIFGLIIVWVLNVSTIRIINEPLSHINDNINKIKDGSYKLVAVDDAPIEMEMINKAVNELSNTMRLNEENKWEREKLLSQLHHIEKENIKKDELVALSELKLLQNQINPHFLFNTLNLIHKTAYEEDAERTAHMVKKTSELLRYALDGTSKTSTLHQEIAAAENYVYIQNKRFGDRIEILMDVDKEVTNIQIPSLIIQPLVENAMQHGLKTIVENGQVIISVHEHGDDIVISVADNGIGMDSAELEHNILRDFKDEKEKKLGLYNVIQRVKMFYGKCATISFNSYIDCGFEVIITISKEGLNA